MLHSSQHSDGGWGYHDGVPSDSDSTAYVLRFLADSDAPKIDVILSGRRWLESWPDLHGGGYSTYPVLAPILSFMGLPGNFDARGWSSASDEVSAACGDALRRCGGDTTRIAHVISYLLNRQRDDGRWRSYWWTTDLYATALSVALFRSCCVSDRMTGDLVSAVESAVAWATEHQHADGSWRDTRSGDATAFATACGLMVVQTGEAADRARAWLTRAQRPDGSWDSAPILRIPPPDVTDPTTVTGWRVDALGTGVVLCDPDRLFTTATVQLAARQSSVH